MYTFFYICYEWEKTISIVFQIYSGGLFCCWGCGGGGGGGGYPGTTADTLKVTLSDTLCHFRQLFV